MKLQIYETEIHETSNLQERRGNVEVKQWARVNRWRKSGREALAFGVGCPKG
jgi:hypothetical protein